MSELLQGGTSQDPRDTGRLFRGRWRWIVWGIAALVVVGAVAFALRPPPKPPPSAAAQLKVVGGLVTPPNTDFVSSPVPAGGFQVTLTLVNTGPTILLSRLVGLPQGLLFDPPPEGLFVTGGASTKVPLDWVSVDCSVSRPELAQQLNSTSLVLVDAHDQSSQIQLADVAGGIDELLSLQAIACLRT